MADRVHLERLTKALIAEGKIIEAGWVGLRLACGLETAPAVQLQEMRKAFFAGAHHLFSSIISHLDDGDEPTTEELERLDKIDEELRRFGDELEAELLPTEGRA